MNVQINQSGRFLVINVDGAITRLNRSQISEISIFRGEFIMIRMLEQIHLFKFSEVTSPQESDIETLASSISSMASEEEDVIEISKQLSKNSEEILTKLSEIQKTFEKGKVVKIVVTDQTQESTES
jgi:hypothetical protein